MIDDHAVGIWMDFRKAVIVRISGSDTEVTEIFSEVTRRPHATGGVRSRWPWWSRSNRSGDHFIQHRNAAIQHYCQMIADRLARGEFVLVVGPGKARCVLRRFLCQRFPGWSAAIATYPLDNHYTIAQITALMRDFFGKNQPRRRRILEGETRAGVWNTNRVHWPIDAFREQQPLEI
jgi:hypothetical protein